jgi:hypothetical protein
VTKKDPVPGGEGLNALISLRGHGHFGDQKVVVRVDFLIFPRLLVLAAELFAPVWGEPFSGVAYVIKSALAEKVVGNRPVTTRR